MLKLETRKVNSILDVEIDGHPYQVDLADQTPFIEFGEIARELATLSELKSNPENSQELIEKCSDIREKLFGLFSKVFGGDESAERLIGPGVNVFKMISAIEIISQIYMSDEAQKLMETMVGKQIATLDTLPSKKEDSSQIDFEQFSQFMKMYEQMKAE